MSICEYKCGVSLFKKKAVLLHIARNICRLNVLFLFFCFSFSCFCSFFNMYGEHIYFVCISSFSCHIRCAMFCLFSFFFLARRLSANVCEYRCTIVIIIMTTTLNACNRLDSSSVVALFITRNLV